MEYGEGFKERKADEEFDMPGYLLGSLAGTVTIYFLRTMLSPLIMYIEKLRTFFVFFFFGGGG